MHVAIRTHSYISENLVSALQVNWKAISQKCLDCPDWVWQSDWEKVNSLQKKSIVGSRAGVSLDVLSQAPPTLLCPKYSVFPVSCSAWHSGLVLCKMHLFGLTLTHSCSYPEGLVLCIFFWDAFNTINYSTLIMLRYWKMESVPCNCSGPALI